MDDAESVDSGGECGIGVAIPIVVAIFRRNCRAIFKAEGGAVDEIVRIADSGGGRHRILD